MQRIVKLIRCVKYFVQTEVVEIDNKTVHSLKHVWVRRLPSDADREFALKIELHASSCLEFLSKNLLRMFRPIASQFTVSIRRDSISAARMELVDRHFIIISRIVLQAPACNTLDAHLQPPTNALLVNACKAKVTV